MTNRAGLTHAYGSAEDVPPLLERAEAGEDVWSGLWSCLCHQGGVGTASYAALPALTRIARARPPADRADPLLPAGAILGSADRPPLPENPHAEYAAEVAELLALTDEALPAAADHAAYVNLLQTLLGLRALHPWTEALDSLIEGEAELPCPRCETDFFAVFGEHGPYTTVDAFYFDDPDVPRPALIPAVPSALTGIAAELHARALADDRPAVAERLTYLFGVGTCPECEAAVRLEDAVLFRWS